MIKTNELPLKAGFAKTDSFLVDMESGTGRILGSELNNFILRSLPHLKALEEASGAGIHNCICRGKALGSTFTAAQANAIADGSFEDLFVGDHWDFTNVSYT